MNTKGYLQQPLTTYEKGKYNKKCCCQSHCVHRESDKFIIANDEGYKQKLVKTNIFETMIEGEPEIFETSYQSLKGFNLKRPQYFPHKEEVQEILCFLKDTTKILIVCGPEGVSRVNTTIKAIRYAVEHDFEAVQDGGYFVDLQDVESM